MTTDLHLKKLVRYAGKYHLHWQFNEARGCFEISSAAAYDLIIHTKFEHGYNELFEEVWTFEEQEATTTYTEAQIREAYDAGVEFENDRCYNPNMYKTHDSDSFYDQFLKALNTPKP